jgi:hypothetical protein
MKITWLRESKHEKKINFNRKINQNRKKKKFKKKNKTYKNIAFSLIIIFIKLS